MNKNILALRGAYLTLVAVGFVIASGPVLAQNTEEITVTAPRAVHQEVGRTMSGGTVDLMSITHHVSYADLNLAKQSDVVELENRINATAAEACKQLDTLYPLLPTDRDCVKNAVDGGMAQANVAIAAAGK